MRSDSSISLISQCSSEGCVSGVGARWGRFYRVLPFVLLGLIGSWIATPAIQGQHPGFTYYFDAETLVSVDDPVSVRAMLDTSGGPVAGWSIVICHDSHLQVVSAVHGESALTMNGDGPADFMSIHFTPHEGVRQGVVVDFMNIEVLWPSHAHELLLIEYELLELPATPITISFCDRIFDGDTFSSETMAVAPGGMVIEPIRSPALLYAPQPFVRGDANGDARVDLADGVALLQITLGGDQSGCADAYDYNDDGHVNFADAISALHGAFGNGPLPPVPGHIDCGIDPTDDTLGCENYSVCP